MKLVPFPSSAFPGGAQYRPESIFCMQPKASGLLAFDLHSGTTLIELKPNPKKK